VKFLLKELIMTYAIIGSGSVGKALARQFARSGIAVKIANTRGPETMASIATELGTHVEPVSLAQALQADTLILAVPFSAHKTVAAMLPDWSDKIIVDTMNTYGIPAAQFNGRPSTDAVAAAFAGARIVKTFNQLAAALLARDPAEHGGRRLMFTASNDPAAENTIVQLVASLGFAPIALGKLAAADALISYGGSGVAGPLVLKDLVQHG
jgi:predicted dinucleotide-binding enzyme